MFVNSLFFFSLHIFIESTWFFHFKSHTTFAWYSWFFTIQFIILFLFLFISLLPAFGDANCKKKIQELLKNVIASLSGKNKPQVSTHTIAMEFVRQSKVWLLIDDKMLFILELKAISIYFPSGFLVVLFRFFMCPKWEI